MWILRTFPQAPASNQQDFAGLSCNLPQSGVEFAQIPIMMDKDRVIEELKQENQQLHDAVHFLNSQLGILSEETRLAHQGPQSPGEPSPLNQEEVNCAQAIIEQQTRREHQHRRNMRQLARVCHELQQIQGKDPFWLSCRHAGAILGVSHAQTARYIHELVADGVLKVIEEHTSNRATRYKYIADSADQAKLCEKRVDAVPAHA